MYLIPLNIKYQSLPPKDKDYQPGKVSKQNVSIWCLQGTHLKYKNINIRYKLLGNQQKSKYQLYAQELQFKILCSINLW